MKNFFSKLQNAAENGKLIRCTLSGYRSGDVKKTVISPVKVSGNIMLLCESFYADGKARHENIPLTSLAEYLAQRALLCRQVNAKCTDSESEMLISKKGACHINEKKAENSVSDPDKAGKKNYIITPEREKDFLVALDIRDKEGRIRDKRQSKFRQINKFLEIVGDVCPKLPKGRVVIWDLCCGKSYLSFAAYHYFANVLKRDVTVYGVDRKKDVMEHCSKIADSLGWDMHFAYGDVSVCLPEEKPDLVLSLHACDIATDIVLASAVKAGAEVILSSPCCQHELSGQISCEKLDFILDHPILKQKLAAIATDALRCKLLTAHGYKVTTLEFIDPEETPKNLMIRAEKVNMSEKAKSKAMEEYLDAKALLSADLTIDRLLRK